MKILIDVNLSPRWVALFQDNGFEAVHWSNIGALTATDAEIINYARLHNYIIFTHDLDFSAILAVTHERQPSVIQARSDDIRPEVLGGQIAATIKQMGSELAAGALITIDARRARLRILPLE